METVTHPVGREFGREIEVERAAVAVQRAELDRLDPLAVQLVPEILAQALTDIGPVGSEINSFGVFHQMFVGLAACCPRLSVLCTSSSPIQPTSASHAGSQT